MSDLGGFILLRFILHPAHSEPLTHSKSHLAFLLGSGLSILPPGTQRAWHLLFPANQQKGDTKGHCQCHDCPDEFMFLCSYFYFSIIYCIICSELVVIVICFPDTIRSTEMPNSFLGFSNCCGWTNSPRVHLLGLRGTCMGVWPNGRTRSIEIGLEKFPPCSPVPVSPHGLFQNWSCHCDVTCHEALMRS